MDDEAVKNAALFFSKEYGTEWGLLFSVHHEIFARPATMLKWTPNVEIQYDEVDGKSYEYGVCSVLEKKTKKRYDKLIFQPDVLKHVKELSQNKPIIEGTQDMISAKYAGMLREYYVEIEKMERDQID